jgi:DNA-binding HxlR family transcriptional regulator
VPQASKRSVPGRRHDDHREAAVVAHEDGWMPPIIRNLFLCCATFTEVREGAPGIPKTVLSERLAGLGRHGVVERRPNPAGRGSTYHLTLSGQELVEVCFALGDWGAKWLDVAPEQLDSHVVLWSMARLVDRDQLPTDRVVLRFDLTDLHRKDRFWTVLERDHTEVCLKNPGFLEAGHAGMVQAHPELLKRCGRPSGHASAPPDREPGRVRPAQHLPLPRRWPPRRRVDPDRQPQRPASARRRGSLPPTSPPSTQSPSSASIRAWRNGRAWIGRGPSRSDDSGMSAQS